MKKSIVIFYFMLLYSLVQLISWGALVVRLEPARMAMVMGEGSVFLFLLCVGAYFLHQSIKKEDRLREQQQNFLLSVTHELKSPLAAIKLSVQTIIKRDLDKARQTSLLNNSLKDIERLDDLVENMLLATKIENGSLSFPKEEFDFSELVTKVTDRLQIHSCGCEQVITLSITPGIKVVGDQFSLSSVVTNLIENAVKYSGPCAEIDVELTVKDGHPFLRVADKGPGIPDQEKMLIFDKFYRVGNENVRKSKGTGLGLFIVKEVLQMHDADISVRDNVPHGAIFEITFS
ncbi:HAMP domain-containing sensor histidine kinase [Pedobacter gandavensis]|uniref:sensor histidine kinase n=1 Tax=Pedobacter TaxID=84567 RepID=UPI001C995645|nr:MULTISPECIES: HAMP domain-containing sensor histidine kinase [Pedobacter]WGQ12086.1 HAMP domain-containing sensor histidine kinase [Pedobacter gandavensis]